MNDTEGAREYHHSQTFVVFHGTQEIALLRPEIPSVSSLIPRGTANDSNRVTGERGKLDNSIAVAQYMKMFDTEQLVSNCAKV